MNDEEIEELWRAVLAGDAGAERRFYYLYLPFVHRRVSWMLFSCLRSGRIRCALRAEDLVQATFLRLLERDRRLLRKFDPTSSNSPPSAARKAYVVGVAGRVAQEEIKKIGRRRPIPDSPDIEKSEGRLTARVDLHNLLAAAIDRLRPSELQILLDLMERELGYQEDRPWTNAQHQALHRLRERLSKILADGRGAPGDAPSPARNSEGVIARIRKLLSALGYEPARERKE